MSLEKRYLFVHLDGLSYSRFQKAVSDGILPVFKEYMSTGAKLFKTHCPLPSNTLNFAVRLFYSPQLLVPGSRWFNRDKEKSFDVKSPLNLLRFERELTDQHPFLLQGGLLFGTMLGKNAHSLGLIKSQFTPANINRSLKYIIRGICDYPPWSFTQKHTYINVVGGIMTAGVEDMIMSIKSQPYRFFYINLMAYDQACHKIGLDADPTNETLSIINNGVLTLLECCHDYELIPLIFSDHGMASALPFSEMDDISFPDYFNGLCRRSSIKCQCYASGNLVHIYFSSPKQLNEVLMDDIGLELSQHRGIEVVIRPQTEKDPIFYIAGHKFGSDSVELDRKIVVQLGQLSTSDLSGDLITFGSSVDGQVVTFMDQRGCHCGWLAKQNECMLILPQSIRTDLSQIENDNVTIIRSIIQGEKAT